VQETIDLIEASPLKDLGREDQQDAKEKLKLNLSQSQAKQNVSNTQLND